MASFSADSFKFVLVSCDDKIPLKQLSASKAGGLEADELQKTAKELFSVGNSDSAGDREQRLETLKAQLLQQGIDPATVDSNMLGAGTDVANMNPIEIITLILPTAANGFIGVSMYCDSNASVKHRPVNQRATVLAQQCGLANLTVVGDAFFGKVYDNEEFPWERRDLSVEDLVGDGWLVRTAAVCNRGKDMSRYSTSGQMQQFMQANGGGGAAAAPSDARLTWTQTDEDVDVLVALPEGAAARDIQVRFGAAGVSVTVAGLAAGEGDDEYGLLSRASGSGALLPTFGGLSAGDCTWCVDVGTGGRRLALTLTKNPEGLKWLSLFKSK
jgi:hypothetical protein